MPRPPSKSELLERLLNAIDESGWRALVIESEHPFLIRIFREDKRSFDVRIYIWNCTPGGRTHLKDEFRIQLTTVVPEIYKGGETLLLGWHEGYEVFAAWDIRYHADQASSSPSAQVDRTALLNAHNHVFAFYQQKRSHQEMVVAFRPEYLVEYALHRAALHGDVGQSKDSNTLLSTLDSAPEAKIARIPDKIRREVVATIKRKYRQHDFRNRVLSAYNHRCTMCGIQLKLVEAAHILPVAHETSNDDTTNGISLCSLHHKAFDNNLISFNEQYEVEVSKREVDGLAAKNLSEGISDFRQNLRPALIMPADRRDYPRPEYISESRRVRRWG